MGGALRTLSRISLATFRPLMPGMRQSSMTALKGSSDASASITACMPAGPDISKLARMPMSSSRAQAPSQAVLSSSTTSTLISLRSLRSTAAPSRSLRCTVTVKVVPLPSSESTSTVPFIRLTTLLTMAMPRPVPSMPVVRESLARVKGSKMVSMNSLLMPQPVSEKTNS